MVNELIISELKRYVLPLDYDLHDWDTIIERRTRYSDDVYIYPCVYADIYLTDELEFYDAEPKQPLHNNMSYNSLSDENKLIASELMEYVLSSDYDLHDWKNIIERRKEIKSGVYSYPCVYADIYLTDELEFYDAEPKQPLKNSLKLKPSEENKVVVNVLCENIPYKYREDVDWDVVLSRREQIAPNLYKYNINNISFYLDDELNVVEYGEVHIINNKIYYDFGLNPLVEDASYFLFNDLSE